MQLGHVKKIATMKYQHSTAIYLKRHSGNTFLEAKQTTYYKYHNGADDQML